MLRYRAMRCNTQRPGQAVRVLFVARMLYRCFDEP